MRAILTGRDRLSVHLLAFVASFSWMTIEPAAAQQDPLRPGEAFATRFSGTVSVTGPDGRQTVAIDPAGTVGSFVDLRAPGQPPSGQHWISEPQRKPVTARDVGQVFGVVLDAASPPNIYLAATSAFGLHRAPDNSQWMSGMWGAGGGPGTLYRLDADSAYRPRVFANVTLDGRPNSGPGLGNVASDKWNQQVFVSDLETGMIHRLRATDGADLGFYDHGTQGRANFLDQLNGQPRNLPPIPFDPASRARIDDCPSGKFDYAPECWNFAASGRRVWGIGVWKHPSTGETRLYYSVWSSPAFGNAGWYALTDDNEKRNSVWSVGLGPDGGFVVADVRREFLLPDFFTDANAIALNGFSSPASDITFPECGGPALMLIGERGGVRNGGLDADKPFAYPSQSRALRYGLTQQGSWRQIGRYDVGFYNRRLDEEPHLRANCAGGVAFGPGYTPGGMADASRPDQFVWISGDALCSPDGPCNADGGQRVPGPQPQTVSAPQSIDLDDSEVHGLQGMPEGLFSEIMLRATTAAEDQPAGVDQAYLIDLDINVDAAGNVIPDTLLRDDATKIGDVAVYQACGAPGAAGAPIQAMAFFLPEIETAHWPVYSHSRAGTHNPQYSHFRHGTHNWKLSHDRSRSHTRGMTHHRYISGPHASERSHNPRASNHPPAASHNRTVSRHRPPESHNPRVSWETPVRSHNPRPSWHRPIGSHDTRRTSLHLRGITAHYPPGSWHLRAVTGHKPEHTHWRVGSNGHRPQDTHRREGSDGHRPQDTHRRAGSDGHRPQDTHRRAGSDGHKPEISHPPVVSHNPRLSAGPAVGITDHRPRGSHSRKASHQPPASHNPRISRGGDGHNRRISAGGGHNRKISRGGAGGGPKIKRGGGDRPKINRGGGGAPKIDRGGGRRGGGFGGGGGGGGRGGGGFGGGGRGFGR